MENRNEKINAQKKLCKDKNYPHFAPPDGYCFYCKRDIYTEITTQSASEHLITGCPHCNYSYCE